MALPAWLTTTGKWIGHLFTRRKQIEGAVESAHDLVRDVEAVMIHDDPPPQPLSHADVRHIQSQIAAATANAAPPAADVCTRTPPGWYCTRAPSHDGACAAYPDGEGPRAQPPATAQTPHPGVVKALPRNAATPREGTRAHPGPPRPPPKRGKKNT